MSKPLRSSGAVLILSPKPSGSSRSSELGSRSGWSQSPSRACDAVLLFDAPPERRRLAQSTRTKFKPDQRRERLLRGTPGGAAATGRLAQCLRTGHSAAGAAVTTVSTQPSTSASSVSSRRKAACCSGSRLWFEEPAGQRVLDALRVGRIDLAHRLLDRREVDLDAARVGVDCAEHALHAATERG